MLWLSGDTRAIKIVMITVVTGEIKRLALAVMVGRMTAVSPHFCVARPR